MEITVAYFHSLLHPDVAKRDFDQIRSAGAGSIVYAIHEQEEQRWPRDLERGMRLVQDAGLKIHLSLGRYGNLFAGPSLVPSWYTFRHPQSRVIVDGEMYTNLAQVKARRRDSHNAQDSSVFLVPHPAPGACHVPGL